MVKHTNNLSLTLTLSFLLTLILTLTLTLSLTYFSYSLTSATDQVCLSVSLSLSSLSSLSVCLSLLSLDVFTPSATDQVCLSVCLMYCEGVSELYAHIHTYIPDPSQRRERQTATRDTYREKIGGDKLHTYIHTFRESSVVCGVLTLLRV